MKKKQLSKDSKLSQTAIILYVDIFIVTSRSPTKKFILILYYISVDSSLKVVSKHQETLKNKCCLLGSYKSYTSRMRALCNYSDISRASCAL